MQSVVTKTQLLTFSIIAFGVLIRAGLYPKEIPSTNLNTDWLYRHVGRYVVGVLAYMARWAWAGVCGGWRATLGAAHGLIRRHYGPDGAMGSAWPTGQMAFWATLMIAAYSLIGFWYLL